MVVEEGKAIGFAIFGLDKPVVGDHVIVEPPGPVGLPPNCTLSPKQMVVSFPASAKGDGKMFTLILITSEGQPQPFKLFKVIVPVPELPQLTVIESVPCPEATVPPVTTQLNVYPEMGLVVYEAVVFGQTVKGPIMVSGGVGGSTVI